MTNKDNILRSFGMSAAQMISELESHERAFGISILVREKDPLRAISGYDQFELEVRRNAAKMSEFYEIFYCLEVSIRGLVNSILSDAEGRDWWVSSRVSDGLRNDVKHLQKKESDSGISLRSDSNLDYLTFGQLGELITSNFDLFETVLTSKAAVSRVMNGLNLLRNPIAHCCILSPDEADRLRLAVLDWFRLFD